MVARIEEREAWTFLSFYKPEEKARVTLISVALISLYALFRSNGYSNFLDKIVAEVGKEGCSAHVRIERALASFTERYSDSCSPVT